MPEAAAPAAPPVSAPGTRSLTRRIIDDNRIINAILKSLAYKKTLTDKDLDDILDATIQKVVKTVKAEAITVFLVKSDALIHFQNVYYSPRIWGKDEAKHKELEEQAGKLHSLTLKPGQGIVGKVIQSGDSSIIADVASDTNFHKKVAEDTKFKVTSMITVPIKADAKAIGAIQVMNKAKEYNKGMFTEDDLHLLQEVAQYSAKAIQKALDPNAKITDREMATYIARLTKHEFLAVDDDFVLDDKLVQVVGEENIKTYRIIPLTKVGHESLKVAMANPQDLPVIDMFQAKTRLAIDTIVVAADSDLQKVIDRFAKKNQQVDGDLLKDIGAEYGEAGGTNVQKVEVDGAADENAAPIIQLCNQIIEDAYSRGASDIHIEPFEKFVLIRYRIDGVCKEIMQIPASTIRALVARYKIMCGAGVDITEHRVPQDGRIHFKTFSKRGLDIDLRVSIAPLNHGEKLCMRILDKTGSLIPLDKMGFSKYNLEIYRKAIQCPYGMILHVGPTGSGKTTTLYAALKEVSNPEWNIQTAEDPIEYTLPGINQMQMHSDVGLTFAKALRCFLRQDPDIILVGEIRDLETAGIAVEAALTGHVLFSTLHTNDAPGTVTRFVDMGIEPFLLSSSMVAVCAQRLMRRLCANCKVKHELTKDDIAVMQLAKDFDTSTITMFDPNPKGCNKCNQLGYKGRTCAHELMVVNDVIKQVIGKHGVSSDEIKKVAMGNGMHSLFMDTVEKVCAGTTSLAEAISIVRPD